jgi:hypothetical protein
VKNRTQHILWLGLGLLLGPVGSGLAQNRVVVGRVLDGQTRQGVDRSTVTNKRTGQRARTNPAGRWLLQAQPGDSLILTSLTHDRAGLRWAGGPAEPILLARRLSEEDIRTVQLAEVEVRGKNEEQLKRELQQVLAEPTAIKGLSGGQVLDYAAGGSVISLLYEAFSRQAKSRRKAVIINQEHRRHLLADYRLRQTIVQVTKLVDDQIEQFILFCNFDDDYLLRASDYELINRVQQLQTAFLANPRQPLNAGNSGIRPDPK